MPQAPSKPCRHRGCRALTVSRSGYCDEHKSEGVWQHSKPVKRTTGRKLQAVRARELRANPMCAVCHERVATELDHIIPLAEGGIDTSDNRQGLCRECHAKKTQEEAKRGRDRRGV